MRVYYDCLNRCLAINVLTYHNDLSYKEKIILGNLNGKAEIAYKI